jgi:hypothetical protein
LEVNKSTVNEQSQNEGFKNENLGVSQNIDNKVHLLESRDEQSQLDGLHDTYSELENRLFESKGQNNKL